MGASASRPKKKDLSPPTLADNCKVREGSPIADKEDAFEFAFMLQQHHMKQWAARDDNLAACLERADNSAFAAMTEFTAQSLPLDEDGFVRAHDCDQVDALTADFDKYGMVVIRNAISPAECEASVAELWDFIERHCSGLDRTNPRTWDKFLPLSKLGILGNTFLLSRQFFENRQAPRVHRAFSALFGTEQLHVNVGRASVMRPTRKVALPADSEHPAEEVDKPEWRTKEGSEWLHWDMNPFNGASSTFSWGVSDPLANRGYTHERLRTQAILALSDCRAEDGGFFCVPGSHKVVRQWAHANKDVVGDQKVSSAESAMQIYLPKNDTLRAHAQKAPIRAGDLLIWDARLLHCNYPNESDQMRMVQYIQMKRADDPALAPLLTDRNLLPESFEMSPLGERLLGFVPWSEKGD